MRRKSRQLHGIWALTRWDDQLWEDGHLPHILLLLTFDVRILGWNTYFYGLCGRFSVRVPTSPLHWGTSISPLISSSACVTVCFRIIQHCFLFWFSTIFFYSETCFKGRLFLHYSSKERVMASPHNVESIFPNYHHHQGLARNLNISQKMMLDIRKKGRKGAANLGINAQKYTYLSREAVP